MTEPARIINASQAAPIGRVASACVTAGSLSLWELVRAWATRTGSFTMKRKK